MSEAMTINDIINQLGEPSGKQRGVCQERPRERNLEGRRHRLRDGHPHPRRPERGGLHRPGDHPGLPAGLQFPGEAVPDPPPEVRGPREANPQRRRLALSCLQQPRPNQPLPLPPLRKEDRVALMGRVERWRDIPGYDGWYQISTEGRVRSYRAYGPGNRLEEPRELHPAFGTPATAHTWWSPSRSTPRRSAPTP